MKVTQPVPNLCLGIFLTALLSFCGKGKFAIKCFGLLGVTIICSLYLPGKVPGIAGLLLLGACVLTRMMIPIALAFTLVFQTTSTSQFMSAFQKIGLPVKIIIPIIIMFRFVPTVQEEWNGIRKAMAFRGIAIRPSGVLRHPVVTIERTLIPLLFSTASIIEELAAASLARGLDSDRRRTCLLRTQMRGWDYGCLLITFGMIGFLLSGYAW